MELADCLPVLVSLPPQQRENLERAAVARSARRGQLVHGGGTGCTGLLAVSSGRLRAFVLSREGREVTLYRLLPGEVCLFSASCALHSVEFELTVSAERDSEFWLIPPDVFSRAMESSAAFAGYINGVMAERFSSVMWLMEQVIWQSMDRRLAGFLLEESAIEGGTELAITHEAIANHLGTHREVVTRMLNYLRGEGLVELGRGRVSLRDARGLERLRDS